MADAGSVLNHAANRYTLDGIIKRELKCLGFPEEKLDRLPIFRSS
jgi:hypothetical protein